MGSFVGHLLPGSFFIWFSMTSLYHFCKSHFSCPHDRQSKSRLLSSPSELSQSFNSYHQLFLQRAATKPLREGLIIIIISTVGVIGEFATGFENGVFTHYANLQHIIMYSGCMMGGIASLLCHYKVAGVPKGLDYFCFCVAMFIEILLFTFHLHGRSPLDIIVHQFLIIIAVVSLCSVIIEWIYMSSKFATIFRIYVTMLQGTWLIQIGFILYNPIPGSQAWADHDHGQLMIVTCIFCLHIIFVLIGVFGMYIFTFRSDPITASALYKELPTQDVES